MIPRPQPEPVSAAAEFPVADKAGLAARSHPALAGSPWADCADTQLLMAALDHWQADARLAACQAEAGALPPWLAPWQQARQALAARGAGALLAGAAPIALLDLYREALQDYLDQLAASAHFGLLCEFGLRVLDETDAAFDSLALRMDPLYDRARLLNDRLSTLATKPALTAPR